MTSWKSELWDGAYFAVVWLLPAVGIVLATVGHFSSSRDLALSGLVFIVPGALVAFACLIAAVIKQRASGRHGDRDR
jgi:hypothetical protein